jgi:voltage-gated potassium channel
MDERSERTARRFDVPMLIAALLVVPVLILQESKVAPWLRTIADALNWVIWVAFLVEVAVMLSAVPRREAWLRRHPLEATVVVFTAPFLPASLQALRVLRVSRVLRLLRLVPSARRVFSVDGLSAARH